MLLTHALALSANQFFMQRKNPYECLHSVRIELAKLILVGTRITYQATGDAIDTYNSDMYHVRNEVVKMYSVMFTPRESEVEGSMPRVRVMVRPWKADNYLKISNWSVFVLLVWCFVFGIIIRWEEGERPSHPDAITTLGLISCLSPTRYFCASRK